jgi:polysaccharide chain length determinant protein (PEP-CTERM system associated)
MDLEADSPADKERLVEELAGDIVLTGGASGKKAWEPKSNIYEISYQDNSANRAYQVVSILLNTMIENTLNSTRTDTVMVQKFLDRQIADYEERLTLAEKELASFKKANVGFMPDEKGGYYIRLKGAEDAVEQTRAALRLAKQRSIELKKQLTGEKALLNGSSFGSPSAIKLRQYQNQLDILLGQYTPQHPDVDELKSMIADLKASMDTGEENTLTAETENTVEYNPVYQELKVEISKSRVEEETLKIQLEEQERYVQELKKSVDIIPEVEAKLAKLNRDYDVTRERYLNLVERRESARLAQDAGQTSSDINFRVIEPPVVPIRPEGPQRLLLLAMVFLVAIGAGIGYSLFRYLLYPTYISLEQVRNRIGLPVLGPVNLYLSAEHKIKRRREMLSFIFILILLTGLFGGAVWYRYEAVTLVNVVLSEVTRQ